MGVRQTKMESSKFRDGGRAKKGATKRLGPHDRARLQENQ
jgi:hypothetical protein